jgi:hypothetical protein
MGCNAPSVPKVVLGVLLPAYRREPTVSRGFGEQQYYLLSVRCDGPGVGRAARRLHCVSGSMEVTSVRIAFVLGADCRKCVRKDTTEARRLERGAVQSMSAISARRRDRSCVGRSTVPIAMARPTGHTLTYTVDVQPQPCPLLGGRQMSIEPGDSVCF